MKTQEAARRAMGLTIDASVSDYELGDVLASAPPRSSTPPPPLLLRQAVKSPSTANVSEGGVVQGRLRSSR